MTNCPPALRGDLSKWLCEINTGVYVGQVSARVREALWGRICQNLKTGSATMVYSANNEQKMEFLVHNTVWTAVDLDGIRLMRRPLPQAAQPAEGLKPGFSKAAKRQIARRQTAAKGKKTERYVVLDLETTGLQPETDEIIEYGALRVEGDSVADRFSCLVRCDRPLPQAVAELTGITDAMLEQQGKDPEQALRECMQFLGDDLLVGYNLAFDLAALRSACRRFGQPLPANRCRDVCTMARRKVYGVSNYKLATLADHFGLPHQSHRALPDCELAWQLYRELCRPVQNETE